MQAPSNAVNIWQVSFSQEPRVDTTLCCFHLQFVDHVEEAAWAVEVLKTSGKAVGATMCISPHGDMQGVPPGECAVRLVKAGTLTSFIL